MAGSSDYVGVVERAYELDGSTEEWLRGVVQAARPILDRGHGVWASLVDTRRGAPETVASVLAGTDFDETAAARFVAAAPRETIEPSYLSGQLCATTSEISRAAGIRAPIVTMPNWLQIGFPKAMADVFGVQIVGPAPGQRLVLHAGLEREARATRAQRRLWGHVAAHIAAGLRLRWVLDPSREVERGEREAVLDPEGRVVDAEGAAEPASRRAALRAAVSRLERARGGLRHADPTEALALWRGLVTGRWTLVDRYESDGRRYLVARRNDPDHAAPRALSERERQVANLAALGQSNKLIAYTLGLSLSTVATHLGRVKRKLGVGSRSELIALLRTLT